MGIKKLTAECNILEKWKTQLINMELDISFWNPIPFFFQRELKWRLC
jgi:hypothetical protein